MSLSKTASQTKPRRRGGRSASMAIDTRYTHVRRRSQAAELPAETPRDWHDWLIPGAVLSCLGSIMLYHHATLLSTIGGLF